LLIIIGIPDILDILAYVESKNSVTRAVLDALFSIEGWYTTRSNC